MYGTPFAGFIHFAYKKTPKVCWRYDFGLSIWDYIRGKRQMNLVMPPFQLDF